MKKNTTKSHAFPNLKLETGESRQPRKKDGPLFYILPPLIVVAVFYYCATVPPPVRSKIPTSAATEQQIITESDAPGVGESQEDVDGDEE